MCGECRVGHGREQGVAVAFVRMWRRGDLRFCSHRHHLRLCLVGWVVIFRIFCYGEAIRVGDPCSIISQLPTYGIGRVDELHISESFRQPPSIIQIPFRAPAGRPPPAPDPPPCFNATDRPWSPCSLQSNYSPSCDERGHRARVAVPREQERRVLALSGARPGSTRLRTGCCHCRRAATATVGSQSFLSSSQLASVRFWVFCVFCKVETVRLEALRRNPAMNQCTYW